MRFVSGVQNDRVEILPTGLMTDVFVDLVESELIEANGVGEGLAAGLKGEFGPNRSQRESAEE